MYVWKQYTLRGCFFFGEVSIYSVFFTKICKRQLHKKAKSCVVILLKKHFIIANLKSWFLKLKINVFDFTCTKTKLKI